jgi:hypothetical protein
MIKQRRRELLERNRERGYEEDHAYNYLAYIIKARRLLTTKYNFTKIIWQFKTF